MTTTTGTTSITVATQKSDTIAEYGALVQGLTTELPAVDTIYVNGVAYKKGDLIAKFQKRLDAATATRNARNDLLACVAAEKAIEEEVSPLRNGTKGFLKNLLGKKSPALQKYGFAPDRTPKKTAATKAAAVVKATATRSAGGTKAKKKAATVTAQPSSPEPTPAPVIPPVTAAPAAPIAKA